MEEEEVRTELGRFLQQRREEAGISQYRLAQLAGIDRTVVLRIESGAIRQPDPRKLASLAKALDLPVTQLYGLAGYPVGRQLPSFQPYLRSRYRDLPPEALSKLDKYFEDIQSQYGGGTGPSDGEDEIPE